MTQNEAKYEKDINDMEVNDTEDSDYVVSPLLDNPASEIPAPVVGDQFGKNATLMSTQALIDLHPPEPEDSTIEVQVQDQTGVDQRVSAKLTLRKSSSREDFEEENENPNEQAAHGRGEQGIEDPPNEFIKKYPQQGDGDQQT